MKDLLKKYLDEYGLEYTPEMTDRISDFYDLLMEKNKVMNLTRIVDEKDYVIKHILDSLLISSVLDPSGKKILDVGCGAGFPGIPLKIFFPDAELVLLDSLNKRLLFINEACESLGLSGISTLHARAEDAGRDPLHREQYDLVVSRAVADMKVLSELCLPFVKVGGYFVAYKSSDAGEEIESASWAVKALGGSPADILDIPLPGSDITRKMVRISKFSKTPKTYPRKAGTPSRDPIQ